MVLAHGTVLKAPALAIVVDQLRRFAGEKEGFLIVLPGYGENSLVRPNSSPVTNI